MDRITSVFNIIGTSGKSAVPKVGSAVKTGLTSVGKLGGKLLKGSESKPKRDDIATVLSEGDIKYGEDVLLNDEAVEVSLNSSKPKDIIKALNTILSVLVYSTNHESLDSLVPRLDTELVDDDIRTRVMKKFYPSVVKCIINENKEVKKLAMFIILHTFTENNESTTHSLNSLLKEVISGDPERRANGVKLMSSIANNDIYPFIYTYILKGMNDLNPFVRRHSYIGLLKLRKNTEFGAAQSYQPESDDESEEDSVSTDDICLRLLRNSLHNITEEEQEVGGQAIKPETNENILAIAVYLLDQIIDEENSNVTENKFKSLHPVFFAILEKLDLVDEIFISQITPILIKYTKRYMGRRIKEARNVPEEDLNLTKDHRRVLDYILNAL